MTEGIIQKVFKKHLTNKSWLDSDDVIDIQQELIEEIKKSFQNNQINFYDVKTPIALSNLIMIELIGDNQE